MTNALTAAAYIVAALFFLKVIWRFFLWHGTGETGQASRRGSHVSAVLWFLDMLFLRRLISTNALLWAGEWVFHASLVLVFFSHLRFFFHPAPEFFTLAVPLGKVAAYTLLASLTYILAFRLFALAFVRGYFTSGYNMFLTAALLLTSLTGYLLRHGYRTDLISVKEYILRGLAFRPVEFPDSAMFAAHFALALLVVSAVPSHIFTAPLTLLDAGRRKEGIGELMHDDER